MEAPSPFNNVTAVRLKLQISNPNYYPEKNGDLKVLVYGKSSGEVLEFRKLEKALRIDKPETTQKQVQYLWGITSHEACQLGMIYSIYDTATATNQGWPVYNSFKVVFTFPYTISKKVEVQIRMSVPKLASGIVEVLPGSLILSSEFQGFNTTLSP